MQGTRPHAIGRLLFAAALACAWALLSVSPASAAYEYAGSFGSPQGGTLNTPRDSAVDASGNVYVSDSGFHRIQKFDSAGNFITQWGRVGGGDGEFRNPTGITVDGAGNVYVAELTNNRVQKFAPDGTFLLKFGTQGTGNGQFQGAYGVAVDSTGSIYVSDQNHRIQKFDSSGTFVTSWGQQGSADGHFNFPFGLAVDASDNLYVADRSNNRIQKFDSSGTFLAKWGSSGSGNGQFSSPWDVAVDSSNNVYVADAINNRIQKFSSGGTFITKWGTSGSGDGQLNLPQGVSAAPGGSVVVTDSSNDRVQRFSPAGAFVAKWGHTTGNGEFKLPGGVATNAAGDVYVSDRSTHRVQRFDSSGSFVTAWGSQGSGDGQFVNPDAMATDASGNVYVLDASNSRVQKFTSGGAFVLKFGSAGSGNGQFFSPTGIAVDSAGDVYVAENQNHRIQKFTSAGAYVTQWGGFGSGDGEFNGPNGIAIDADGNVYVADSNNSRVQKFTIGGAYVSQWAITQGGDPAFPLGVATDDADDVVVSVFGNSGTAEFQKFSAAGALVETWDGGDEVGSVSQIATGPGGRLYAPDNVRFRVNVFERLPSVSVGDVTVTEGDSGTSNASFQVTLDAASDETVTVDYDTSDGTAGSPADFTAQSDTVTFEPGETTQTVAVPVAGDTTDEPNESFTLDLSDVSAGAEIDDGSGSGTITDDDDAPSASVADVTVAEGNSGSLNAGFQVTLSNPSSQSVTVEYDTTNGTAVAPGDYTAVSNTLTFDPGQTSKTVDVPVVGDTTDEPDEAFTLDLSDPSASATIGDGQATGTITDDDDPPTISVADVTVTEGDSGTANAGLQVTLSNPSSQSVTVEYDTTNGTAVAPGDYTAVSNTLTFDPGQTSKTVDVPVVGDTTDEPDEAFTLDLSNASVTVTDGQAVATINDNDDPPEISVVGDVATTEGNSGNTAAVFQVDLDAASGRTVQVAFGTAADTATAPADYAATSGTLTFDPGQTSKTVTVQVAGDVIDEPDEAYSLVISSPSNVSIDDPDGTGTITDDDATPQATIDDASVTEGNQGNVQAVFDLSLSGPSSQAVTVTRKTTNGTATAPSDFIALDPATVTFAPGETEKTVTVQVIGDSNDEPDEQFTVELPGATNATVAGDPAIGTIVDDDLPPVFVPPPPIDPGTPAKPKCKKGQKLKKVKGKFKCVKKRKKKR